MRPDYEVDEATGCWVWLKYKQRDGYGVKGVGNRTQLAHRAYYEMHVGPLKADQSIHHICRNRACVNPEHLEAVTRTEHGQRHSGHPMSLVEGVTWHAATGMWQALKRGTYLGLYETEDEAAAAVSSGVHLAKVGRTCNWCSEPMPATLSAQARYCSNICKWRADYDRRFRQAAA